MLPAGHLIVAPADAEAVVEARRDRGAGAGGEPRLEHRPRPEAASRPFATVVWQETRTIETSIREALRASRYNTQVITRGIRELANRDWAAARASKDTYWGDRIAQLGPAEGLRIADELRRQAMLQDPDWPRPSDRRGDLLCHVRLAELLRRVRPTRRP